MPGIEPGCAAFGPSGELSLPGKSLGKSPATYSEQLWLFLVLLALGRGCALLFLVVVILSEVVFGFPPPWKSFARELNEVSKIPALQDVS